MRIGDMLVSAGIVTREDVDAAAMAQRASGKRLGAELVRQGKVSEVQLTQMLSNQMSVPWVNLQHVEFSRELLSLVPEEIADEWGCIPVYKREVRKEGATLFVAMDDPSNEEARAAIQAVVSLPIKAMVAPPSDIRKAIRVYYFGETPSLPGGPGDKSAPEPRKRASRHPGEPQPSPLSVPPPASDLVPEAEHHTETRHDHSEVETASKRDRAGSSSSETVSEKAWQQDAGAVPTVATPRFVTLTLLDGTTVRLPSPVGKSAPSSSPPAQGLTASDLVNALLARGQGAQVDDILGDDRWELLFATLLSLLIRKGLIADWEFVEAWQKSQTPGPPSSS